MHTALALALITAAVAGPADFLLQPGDKAPPYRMRDLDNNMFSLRDITGPDAKAEVKKTVLQVFFATWCEPCKTELEDIRKIEKLWKTREVEVVHIGLEHGSKDLIPFALEHRINWPIVPDQWAILGRRYGVSKLPHLFIIDRDGTIAYQKRGIDPNLFDTLNAQLALATGYEAPVVASKRALNAPQIVDAPRFDTALSFARSPSSDDSAVKWQPLATYVGESVQASINMVQEKAYAAFEKKIKRGDYDLFNAGPLLCNEASDKYEPLVLIEREGSPSYTGITFVNRKSSIRNVSDLKGKTIGLVSPTSTSGGLYPKKLLLDAGLRPGKDVKIKWFGSHSKVAKAVRKGWVHAGACFEDCRDLAWSTPLEKAKATRIIAYTADIPAEMIMVKRSLTSEQKRLMREALTKAPSQGGILSRISRGEAPISAIVEATDKNLEPIKMVINQVKGRK